MAASSRCMASARQKSSATTPEEEQQQRQTQHPQSDRTPLRTQGRLRYRSTSSEWEAPTHRPPTSPQGVATSGTQTWTSAVTTEPRSKLHASDRITCAETQLHRTNEDEPSRARARGWPSFPSPPELPAEMSSSITAALTASAAAASANTRRSDQGPNARTASAAGKRRTPTAMTQFHGRMTPIVQGGNSLVACAVISMTKSGVNGCPGRRTRRCQTHSPPPGPSRMTPRPSRPFGLPATGPRHPRLSAGIPPPMS